ncbi:hypothetical protein RRG08_057357 [Elysia crispata]|uniref:Uncharacterized protein n=1 Tax=Elysia crispata TaxID=231223 RepID=A0AAE0YJH2_9GAST|nr:hypothetical protein RRG08_057357 [Elysia crispata]
MRSAPAKGMFKNCGGLLANPMIFDNSESIAPMKHPRSATPRGPGFISFPKGTPKPLPKPLLHKLPVTQSIEGAKPPPRSPRFNISEGQPCCQRIAETPARVARRWKYHPRDSIPLVSLGDGQTPPKEGVSQGFWRP